MAEPLSQDPSAGGAEDLYSDPDFIKIKNEHPDWSDADVSAVLFNARRSQKDPVNTARAISGTLETQRTGTSVGDIEPLSGISRQDPVTMSRLREMQGPFNPAFEGPGLEGTAIGPPMPDIEPLSGISRRDPVTMSRLRELQAPVNPNAAFQGPLPGPLPEGPGSQGPVPGIEPLSGISRRDPATMSRLQERPMPERWDDPSKDAVSAAFLRERGKAFGDAHGQIEVGTRVVPGMTDESGYPGETNILEGMLTAEQVADLSDEEAQAWAENNMVTILAKQHYSLTRKASLGELTPMEQERLDELEGRPDVIKRAQEIGLYEGSDLVEPRIVDLPRLDRPELPQDQVAETDELAPISDLDMASDATSPMQQMQALEAEGPEVKEQSWLRKILPYLAVGGGTALAAGLGGANFRRGLAGGLTQLGPALAQRASEKRKLASAERIAREKALRGTATSVYENQLRTLRSISPGADRQNYFDDIDDWGPFANQAQVLAGQRGEVPIEDMRDFEDDISKEYGAHKETEQYRNVKSAAARTRGLLTQDGKAALDRQFENADEVWRGRSNVEGIQEVYALWQLVKVVDPDSVVRESEIGLVVSGLPMFSKIYDTINRVLRGSVLPDEVIPSIQEALETIEDTQVLRYREFRKGMLGRAERYGSKKGDRLFPDLSEGYDAERAERLRRRTRGANPDQPEVDRTQEDAEEARRRGLIQ